MINIGELPFSFLFPSLTTYLIETNRDIVIISIPGIRNRQNAKIVFCFYQNLNIKHKRYKVVPTISLKRLNSAPR